jgi:hypothetical protein
MVQEIQIRWRSKLLFVQKQAIRANRFRISGLNAKIADAPTGRSISPAIVLFRNISRKGR